MGERWWTCKTRSTTSVAAAKDSGEGVASGLVGRDSRARCTKPTLRLRTSADHRKQVATVAANVSTLATNCPPPCERNRWLGERDRWVRLRLCLMWWYTGGTSVGGDEAPAAAARRRPAPPGTRARSWCRSTSPAAAPSRSKVPIGGGQRTSCTVRSKPSEAHEAGHRTYGWR